jgi:hypothetical protein
VVGIRVDGPRAERRVMGRREAGGGDTVSGFVLSELRVGRLGRMYGEPGLRCYWRRASSQA